MSRLTICATKQLAKQQLWNPTTSHWSCCYLPSSPWGGVPAQTFREPLRLLIRGLVGYSSSTKENITIHWLISNTWANHRKIERIHIWACKVLCPWAPSMQEQGVWSGHGHGTSKWVGLIFKVKSLWFHLCLCVQHHGSGTQQISTSFQSLQHTLAFCARPVDNCFKFPLIWPFTWSITPLSCTCSH